MELSMSLPLDGNFLRRQCPHCQREFKWHNGPTDDRPEQEQDPPDYHCPYCGQTSGPDDWWTVEQRDHAQVIVAVEAEALIENEFRSMARKFRNGPVKMEVKSGDSHLPPASLIEPSDMFQVASPCHPWEPIRAFFIICNLLPDRIHGRRPR
ncbi:hypothetical protein BH23CHL5_BH23CHL5_23950 [soil metagenome]